MRGLTKGKGSIYWDIMLLFRARNLIKLKKLPNKTNSNRIWWFFRYWGIYIDCPNPDCNFHLCLPTKKDILIDQDYECLECGFIFKVLDVFQEEELTALGWVKSWRPFYRYWRKEEEEMGGMIRKKNQAPTGVRA